MASTPESRSCRTCGSSGLRLCSSISSIASRCRDSEAGSRSRPTACCRIVRCSATYASGLRWANSASKTSRTRSCRCSPSPERPTNGRAASQRPHLRRPRADRRGEQVLGGPVRVRAGRQAGAVVGVRHLADQHPAQLGDQLRQLVEPGRHGAAGAGLGEQGEGERVAAAQRGEPADAGPRVRRAGRAARRSPPAAARPGRAGAAAAASPGRPTSRRPAAPARPARPPSRPAATAAGARGTTGPAG